MTHLGGADVDVQGRVPQPRQRHQPESTGVDTVVRAHLDEEQQLDALAACGRLALTAGKRERSGAALGIVEEDEVERPRGGSAANVNGINVYASSPVDRETLERLCRYLPRRPLALHRLKVRPDGMLSYRLKKPDRRGNTVLVLSPHELPARLGSLIPAPRHPTRGHFWRRPLFNGNIGAGTRPAGERCCRLTLRGAATTA